MITEITAVIAISIAVASLIISIIILLRNKPILEVEKHSAGIIKNSNIVKFIFYISNVGEKPTTIKSIEFHTDSNYMPKTTICKLKEQTIPNMDRTVSRENSEGMEFPFNLMPYNSFKLLAELDFSSSDVFKKETASGKLHYHIRIKHIKGLFKDKI